MVRSSSSLLIRRRHEILADAKLAHVDARVIPQLLPLAGHDHV